MKKSDHSQLSWALIARLFKKTGQAWMDDKAARLGAALAYYSVLSFAPLLLLVLSAATSIWGQEAAQGQILGQVTAIVGKQGGEAIQNILAAGAQNHTTGVIATCVGLATLLFSASGVFGELQDAMNIIWKAKPRRGRAIPVYLRERFFSFTMVVGSGFLLLISLIVSAWLAALSHYFNDLLPDFIVLMQLLNALISFGVITFIFALTFKVVPDVIIPWRSVWWGGALTATLFMAGKWLIGLYLSHAAIESTYGATGSFVVLLLWVYYSAQILFFGAEFTYAYSDHFKLHEKHAVM